MTDQKNDLEELAQEVRKTIAGNRKFLQRVFDEDFDAEDDEGGETEVFEEL